MWRFLRDSVEELFSLDGRLLRGLRDVGLRPGYLTKEYFRGRRVRHMHPLRLFLVASAIAYGVYVLFGSDRSGLLLGLADLLVGDEPDLETLGTVVLVLLLTPLAQRMVYRGAGRLYVEHMVAVLHVSSFAMLLAPLEVLVFSVIPVAVGGDIELVVAPVIVMYWVLALQEVFEDTLAVTLLRAGLTFVLTIVLFVATALVIYTITGAAS